MGSAARSRSIRFAGLLTLVALGACDALAPTVAENGVEDSQSPVPEEGFTGADFSVGPAQSLTSSNQDVWPELEGDYVAWYRQAPAEEQGVWLMELGSGSSRLVWAGEVLSAFDLLDGELFWGSDDGLHTYDIASDDLETLDSTFRRYRDVSAGPRYIVGTAHQSSDRPFVFDRATGVIELVPTPTSVPATRGDGDYVLWSDTRESLRKRDLFVLHIPSQQETAVTDQDQLLTSGNADISMGRVAYFDRRFCPGGLQLFDLESGVTTPVDLPDVTCPTVVALEGDVLVYRYAVSGGRIFLGFIHLSENERVEFDLANPGNWRIDADLDGPRVVHTSLDGLVLVDLQFQPDSPPVADAGGPYEVMEGAELTLDGSGSFSLNDVPLSYAWNVGSGTVLEGPSPTWSWPDNGTFTVTLEVSEASGLSDSDDATVQVINQAPALFMSGAASNARGARPVLRGMVGSPMTVNARFSDPGLMDAPWHWAMRWDDGEIAEGVLEEQGALPEVSFTPTRAGAFTLTVQITDKDGGEARMEVPVEVELPPLRVFAGEWPNHAIPALNSNGVFSVVVYGEAWISMESLDLTTLRLGPGGAQPLMDNGKAPSMHDKDGDGVGDVLLYFRVPDAGLAPTDEDICLTVSTHDGVEAAGCSPIRIAGSENGGGKKNGS